MAVCFCLNSHPLCMCLFLSAIHFSLLYSLSFVLYFSKVVYSFLISLLCASHLLLPLMLFISISINVIVTWRSIPTDKQIFSPFFPPHIDLMFLTSSWAHTSSHPAAPILCSYIIVVTVGCLPPYGAKCCAAPAAFIQWHSVLLWRDSADVNVTRTEKKIYFFAWSCLAEREVSCLTRGKKKKISVCNCCWLWKKTTLLRFPSMQHTSCVVEFSPPTLICISLSRVIMSPPSPCLEIPGKTN